MQYVYVVVGGWVSVSVIVWVSISVSVYVWVSMCEYVCIGQLAGAVRFQKHSTSTTRSMCATFGSVWLHVFF